MDKYKIIISVLCCFALVAAVYISYSLYEMKKLSKHIEESVIEQKKITDDILRSSSKYATSDDIEKYMADNKIAIDKIRKDLAIINGEITSINTVDYKSNGYVISGGTSSSVEKNPTVTNETKCIDNKCVDTYGYLATKQTFNLYEKFNDLKVPFGSVSFSAGKQYPWDLKIEDRTYKIYTIVGENEEGRQVFYNKAKLKVGDKEYDIPAYQAETLQQVLKSKITWWNPAVYFGMSASAFSRKDIGANASFGFITYGKTKTQPTFSIMQTGIGYGMVQKTPYLFVTPVSYRLGDSLPLLKNTYIGASVGFDLNTNTYISAGISTQL